ncbi:MAG: NAD(P)/FAD-dependent oxidoreductase, partial [Proteobacteria bacterium]|nr:NAD(P)/FAD-dependent oxidoreductase [Pseudomonadota bacterium]
MAHVVIIGASTGGLPAAYEMRSALGDEHQVTVVSNAPIFHFVPSNPWVAVGWRTRKDISFDLEPRLNDKGITFSAEAVSEIRAEDNQLVLGDGSSLAY